MLFIYFGSKFPYVHASAHMYIVYVVVRETGTARAFYFPCFFHHYYCDKLASIYQGKVTLRNTVPTTMIVHTGLLQLLNRLANSLYFIDKLC